VDTTSEITPKSLQSQFGQKYDNNSVRNKSQKPNEFMAQSLETVPGTFDFLGKGLQRDNQDHTIVDVSDCGTDILIDQ
jgi:hypothetical protein